MVSAMCGVQHKYINRSKDLMLLLVLNGAKDQIYAANCVRLSGQDWMVRILRWP